MLTPISLLLANKREGLYKCRFELWNFYNPSRTWRVMTAVFLSIDWLDSPRVHQKDNALWLFCGVPLQPVWDCPYQVPVR